MHFENMAEDKDIRETTEGESSSECVRYRILKRPSSLHISVQHGHEDEHGQNDNTIVAREKAVMMTISPAEMVIAEGEEEDRVGSIVNLDNTYGNEDDNDVVEDGVINGGMMGSGETAMSVSSNSIGSKSNSVRMGNAELYSERGSDISDSKFLIPMGFGDQCTNSSPSGSAPNSPTHSACSNISELSVSSNSTFGFSTTASVVSGGSTTHRREWKGNDMKSGTRCSVTFDLNTIHDEEGTVELDAVSISVSVTADGEDETIEYNSDIGNASNGMDQTISSPIHSTVSDTKSFLSAQMMSLTTNSNSDDENDMPAHVQSKSNGAHRSDIQSPGGYDRRLFVGKLPHFVTEDDLRKHFVKYGRLLDVYIPRAGEKSKGFGFLTFEMLPQSTTIFTDEHEISGRHVIIDEAEPKPEQMYSQSQMPLYEHHPNSNTVGYQHAAGKKSHRRSTKHSRQRPRPQQQQQRWYDPQSMVIYPPHFGYQSYPSLPMYPIYGDYRTGQAYYPTPQIYQHQHATMMATAPYQIHPNRAQTRNVNTSHEDDQVATSSSGGMSANTTMHMAPPSFVPPYGFYAPMPQYRKRRPHNDDPKR